MENGDSLFLTNNSTTSEYFLGSSFNQGIVAIPDPANSNNYYLLHTNHEIINLTWPAVGGSGSTHLLWSKIDMTQNGGLGAVTEKNQVAIADTLLPGGLTAVRHANGRDWWVLVFEFQSKKYYRVLVSDQGVTVAGTGQIDVTVTKNILAMFCFSPDGSKFIVTPTNSDGLNRHWLEIFDFDRCTGLLSNRKRVYYSKKILESNLYVDDYAQSISVSPNSRFLYLFLFNRIYQLDLSVPDLQNSLHLVAHYDGFRTPDQYQFRTLFGLSQLAPDGRIYANTANPSQFMHVVTQPNNGGLSSLLQQRGLELCGINWYAMPNHPNYRLGPLEGSACDTLGVEKAVFIHAQPYPSGGCVGGNAHFEVTAFGTGLGYQWQASYDDGGAWANLENDAVFSGTNTYYLTLQNIPSAWQQAQFRCIVSGNVNADTSAAGILTLLNETPSAAFDYTQNLDSIYFQNLATGADYVQWHSGAGDSMLIEHPAYLYKAAGTWQAMQVATNACGQDTFIQEIVIPELTADFEASKTFGCAPLTVTFTSHSAYRARHTYWMTGASPNFTNTFRNPTVTYNAPGVYDVKLDLTTPPLYQEASILLKEDYITVISGVNPVADIDALQSGNAFIFSTPFSQADSYLWQLSNGDTLSGQSANYEFDAPGVYEVILQTSNQCGVALDTLELLVGELAASFSSNVQAGCAPLLVQFENTTQFPIDSVRWHFESGQPVTSTLANPLATYPIAGAFDVTMIAYSGSFSDTILLEDGIEIWQNACPEASISAQTNYLEVTAWTDCQEGSDYQWDMGDGTILNGQGVTYQYDTSGIYNITLIISDLCGTDTASFLVEAVSPLGSTERLDWQNAFAVQPNPADLLLEISAKRPAAHPVRFRLFNAVGEEVIAHSIGTWKVSERVSVAHLPAGYYFYEFQQEGSAGQHCGKLVIAR